MTRDIDLVAELSGWDAKSVAALFAPDYYVSDAHIAAAMAGEGMFNVLHLVQLVKLDFIVRKDSPYRRHEFGRRQRVRLPGFEAWIVSREDCGDCEVPEARDTTAEFRKRVEESYARLAPEERVRICTEMFDTAVALAASSLPDGLDPVERHFRLCERLHGDLAARALPRR